MFAVFPGTISAPINLLGALRDIHNDYREAILKEITERADHAAAPNEGRPWNDVAAEALEELQGAVSRFALAETRALARTIVKACSGPEDPGEFDDEGNQAVAEVFLRVRMVSWRDRQAFEERISRAVLSRDVVAETDARSEYLKAALVSVAGVEGIPAGDLSAVGLEALEAMGLQDALMQAAGWAMRLGVGEKKAFWPPEPTT